MINGLITAIRTLTRIPIRGKDAQNFASSLPWFPLVGFLLAAFLSGIVIFLQVIVNIEWNEAIAFFILLASVFLTGALHLDGFADWADSLGALYSKEKMLKIMKDSNSGAFGVVALVLLMLAKWIALVQLLNLNIVIIGLFIAYISSRFAMVYLSVTLPYARAEGGTGEAIVKGASKKHLVVAFLISLSILYFVGDILAIILFFFALPIPLLWKYWCKKHLNGITGDLLGAGSEWVETIVLFVTALFYNSITLYIP